MLPTPLASESYRTSRWPSLPAGANGAVGDDARGYYHQFAVIASEAYGFDRYHARHRTIEITPSASAAQ